MRSDMVFSEASARDALEDLYSPDGRRLPRLRAIHAAAADVEEGREFWKAIVGNIPSQHRVSRKFLKCQG